MKIPAQVQEYLDNGWKQVMFANNGNFHYFLLGEGGKAVRWLSFTILWQEREAQWEEQEAGEMITDVGCANREFTFSRLMLQFAEQVYIDDLESAW